MRLMLFTFFLCVSLVSSAIAATPDRLGFVDVEKVMQESKPAKLGSEHLAKVQAILQEAFNEAVAINDAKIKKAKKESEKNKLAQVIQQDRLILERELQGQRQLVQNEILRLIAKASKEWQEDNKKYGGIFPKGSAFAVTEDADKTEEIMELINKMSPKFPALPKVNVAKTK